MTTFNYCSNKKILTRELKNAQIYIFLENYDFKIVFQSILIFFAD